MSGAAHTTVKTNAPSRLLFGWSRTVRRPVCGNSVLAAAATDQKVATANFGAICKADKTVV